MCGHVGSYASFLIDLTIHPLPSPTVHSFLDPTLPGPSSSFPSGPLGSSSRIMARSSAHNPST